MRYLFCTHNKMMAFQHRRTQAHASVWQLICPRAWRLTARLCTTQHVGSVGFVCLFPSLFHQHQNKIGLAEPAGNDSLITSNNFLHRSVCLLCVHRIFFPSPVRGTWYSHMCMLSAMSAMSTRHHPDKSNN